MSNVASAIRHKRFKFKADSNLELCIVTKTGSLTTLRLVDCSRNGLCAEIPADQVLDEEFMPNSIIQSSKIKMADSEFALGRLVLRTIRTIKGNQLLGFSAVDKVVPIDGVISRFLDTNLDGENPHFDFELSPDKFSIANFTDQNQSNVDLFAKCKQFSIYYKEWRKSKKYAYHTIRTESMGTRINLTRKRELNRNDYIIMGSNDYLGLASHPSVIEAAKSALGTYGFGSTGSPVTTGLTDLHEKLTSRLAKLFGKEKAILYNSGYVANIGIINGLTGQQDLIAADFLSHASVADAIQMSKASSRFFKHNSAKHLDKIMTENRMKHAGALVITEGVFSMDGDVANLKEIFKTARDHTARIMVDEAHSFGVLGDTGRGACEKYNLLSQVDVIMGTFSKIGGGIGGFVVGSEAVIDWLHHFSRAYLFSVTLPPSTVAAMNASLEIFESEPERVQRLKRNIQQFVNGVRHLGFDTPENHESTIVPIVIGDEKKLGIMNEKFLNAGVFVVPIIYPAVSRKNCRFRFTVTSELTPAEIDYVIMVLDMAMKAADFAPKTIKDDTEE